MEARFRTQNTGNYRTALTTEREVYDMTTWPRGNTNIEETGNYGCS